MSSPSEILKRAREQSGKVPEKVVRLAGIGKNKYYDLEAYDDEIETNTSIKELRDIGTMNQRERAGPFSPLTPALSPLREEGDVNSLPLGRELGP